MGLFLTKKRKQKKIKDLDTKFQYYHALLIGECKQILERIDVISHANLIYSQYHSENYKKFLDILNKEDKTCSRYIEVLDDHILDPKKANFKEDYNNAKVNLDRFKLEVVNLNDKLLEIIRPEEEARNKALAVKEYESVIKKKYLQQNSAFEICTPAFDKLFSAIDKKFQLFDNYIDSAEYDTAVDLLPKIKKVLEEINRVIALLPKLVVVISSVIPLLIEGVVSKYDTLDSKKIPLFHLAPKKVIKLFKEEHAHITDLVKNLKVEEGTKRSNNLIEKIELFEKSLVLEEESKEFYDKNFAPIYDYANALAKKIINLYNEIPNIQKVYMFDDFHKDILSSLQAKEGELNIARRNLDVNLLTTTRQPYSTIISKIKSLDVVTKEVNDYIEAFNGYVLSLKTDCERAFNLVSNEYSVIRKYLVKFESLKITDVQYNEDFDRLYELLDSIVALIKKKPVDVISLNRNLNEYKNFSTVIYDKINSMYDKKIQCEKYFRALNKFKVDFESVELNIKSAEELYKKGEYYSCFVVLDRVYKECINIA